MVRRAATKPISSAGTNASARDSTGLVLISLAKLKPSVKNARKHDLEQIRAIAKSIETFGFNAPILVSAEHEIVAGHGRYEAAKLLGLTEVPVIQLSHLTSAQATAYMLADNKLTDRSSWDDHKLADQLKELSELAIEFDIEATGFQAPEIDLRIQSLEPADSDAADNFEYVPSPIVSRPGDSWQLGNHRLFCGDALIAESYSKLLGIEQASMVMTDPPYNVRIDGHASGKGTRRHREFAMASGEMTAGQFQTFLASALSNLTAYSAPNALLYICMDWRHMSELLAASQASDLALLNLCVWAKTNGGMGSLYRSRHELIFVFKKPGASHTNNVQLGQFGRNRTNVWNYSGANVFPKGGRKRQTDFHPTVKPIGLVADAMLDCTRRGDIVLDPFCGSGTAILAAERTERQAYVMELDPAYVDLAIRRWQKLTGRIARNKAGESFQDVSIERGLS